jgi:hypothetical protein
MLNFKLTTEKRGKRLKEKGARIALRRNSKFSMLNFKLTANNRCKVKGTAGIVE